MNTLDFVVLPSLLAFAWPGWLIGLSVMLFLAVCVLMVLAVLIQKPQGGGLTSAFGGGVSAGQTAFGTKTGDALTVFTIGVFTLYLLLAVALNYAARPQAAPTEAEASSTVPLSDRGPATPTQTPTDIPANLDIPATGEVPAGTPAPESKAPDAAATTGATAPGTGAPGTAAPVTAPGTTPPATTPPATTSPVTTPPATTPPATNPGK